LATSVAADYQEDVRLVDALSKAYGFHYLFFWQPSLFSRTVPSPEELSYSDWQFSDLISLFKLTNENIRKSHIDRLIDLTAVFDSRTETIYIDFCHTSEEGNNIIANEIAKHLRKLNHHV